MPVANTKLASESIYGRIHDTNDWLKGNNRPAHGHREKGTNFEDQRKIYTFSLDIQKKEAQNRARSSYPNHDKILTP